ncbi:MAG: glycosyltransferase [Sediminimonas qiaohouensis]|uniref:Glycosyltransferase n=1 Tax=Sediminimonas qiaohouensis TaxID=552061 RepID=A0A7C9HB58_9RHOB|nr:glycosyltransferase [Sediminimonas qiaohouensis]MTJ04764.1 glycosyltransferase [Sediminimonas qiaohouensis]
MNILFIHQNFPGQFKHLAPALAAGGHRCVALTLRVEKPIRWNGVQVLPYALPESRRQHVHPWLIDLDTKVTRGEACFYAALSLRDQGFTPDIIVAHPGWGESMFLRDVWPEARIGLYYELFHRSDGDHMAFDPEFMREAGPGEALRIRLKNLNNRLHLPVGDLGISPTRFQADTYPPEFRERISVIHDGVPTDLLWPDRSVALHLPEGGRVTREDEVITFVNRNLEPYRGYHVFMRALPRLLRERPRAQVLIVGGDGVSYGSRPPEGQTWKQVFIDEVRAQIPDADWARVHFMGKLPYDRFATLLAVSRVHVYLTYPFVLSWSLLEAMSVGAAIVASDTAPVREVIADGETGLLTGFFDQDALIASVCGLLDDPEARERLGRAARAHVRQHYDLETVCLPAQMRWVDRLAAMTPGTVGD